MTPNQQVASEIHFILKALGYFKTHWWLILLEILVIYGYNLNQYRKTPSVYNSSGAILIDESRKNFYNKQLFSTVGRSSKKNMVHLLTSSEVFNRFRIAFTEHFNSEGRPLHLRNFFPNGNAIGSEAFRNYINVSWNKDADIYYINCESNNPESAYSICKVFMDVIYNYYPEIGSKEIMMQREFLARQISIQSREIYERENALVEYQKKNSELMDFIMGGGNEKALSQLRMEIAKTQEKIHDTLSMKELLLKIPQAKRGEHVALQKSIRAMTEQVTNLQYQIELMTQSMDPEKEQKLAVLNEKLSQVSSQLASLNEKELNLFVKNPLDSSTVKDQIAKLEFEYRLNVISLRTKEKQLANLTEKAKQYQPQILELERLKSDLGSRKKLLSSLFKKEQQLEIELSAGQAEVFRLNEPVRNINRISPFISKYLYASLSFSLFVIAVTILLLMAIFPRIDSESEANRLNLPVLGKVPFMRGIRAHEIPTIGLEQSKIMLYRIAREMKSIKCPIIIVSSSNPKEGKSVVAHCLCLSSQSSTKKTLLIDGDLLTTKSNHFLGIREDQTPGLKSILSENSDINPSELIVKSIIDGVSYMPRGGRIEPQKLQDTSTQIEKLLSKLKNEFDMIIIDTPPLSASNITHQWLNFGQLIILVARIYQTKPRDINESIQTCKVFSKAPIGVALNCVSVPKSYYMSQYYFSKKKARLAA